MPELFGLHAVSYGQALGLLLLSKILFGGFRGGRARQMFWRRRMMARWEKMTPEEREKFRQGMQGRCGPFGPAGGRERKGPRMTAVEAAILRSSRAGPLAKLVERGARRRRRRWLGERLGWLSHLPDCATAVVLPVARRARGRSWRRASARNRCHKATWCWKCEPAATWKP